MCERSASSIVTGADDLRGGVEFGQRTIQHSDLSNRITERSMKFCNSRTLPGQE